MLAYRTTKEVFGVERTVLVTDNENLFVAQSRTLLREIAKRQTRLRELQHQLRRRRQGNPRREAADGPGDPGRRSTDGSRRGT